MGELLLISDDLPRANRIARELNVTGDLSVHDLYAMDFPMGSPEIIISDVALLTSNAFTRLKRFLEHIHAKDVPLLFLVYGNAARTEAQARVLGASATLAAGSSFGFLRGKIAEMLRASRSDPAPVAIKAAEAARTFLTDNFFSSQNTITPALAEAGTGLIMRAVRETAIGDWVRAVQRFDEITHQHCLLVAGVAAAFATSLGMGEADSYRLTKAALLHDVGKTRLPSAILNKPGRLSDAEMAVVRAHPAIGYDMLKGGGFEKETLQVVRSHHEMLDGSGYPDALRAAEIADLVRLVTICDIYGALIERRSYKAPMPGINAYAILQSMAGRLDPDLVHAFGLIAHSYDADTKPLRPAEALSRQRKAI